MQMQIVKLTFVIAAPVVIAADGTGPKWYVGGHDRWSSERPDAMEYPTWESARETLAWVRRASPRSILAKLAEVITEEKETV